MGVGDVSKRILLGRKLRSSQLGETLLPKRIALPVFASDALSSVAYAPDEIFIMLSVAGASAYVWSWKIGIAVALVMLTVVASYRQNVHAYPSGGGDYEVATVNLGRNAGVTVASALLVDYVLTVAVSISSARAVRRRGDPVPRRPRGDRRRSSLVVAADGDEPARRPRVRARSSPSRPTCFMVAILGMCALRAAAAARRRPARTSRAPACRSSRRPGYEGALTTVALMFLLARAFSSGCAALTGVEAISNGVPGVPQAQEPQRRDHAAAARR